MGIVGSICFILGITTYQLFMKYWKYRSVLYFNNIIFVFVALLNIVLYKRWNISLGIPDKVFVLGAETFQVVIAAWNSMPMTLILSQLCPKGMEATMFALLAGSSNLGSSLAQYQGVFILDLLGINPNGSVNESFKFKNLWLASLISTLLPIISIFLIPYLIPDAYQTDKLLDEDGDEGTDNNSDEKEDDNFSNNSVYKMSEEEIIKHIKTQTNFIVNNDKDDDYGDMKYTLSTTSSSSSSDDLDILNQKK